jgi:hypothetical protein
MANSLGAYPSSTILVRLKTDRRVGVDRRQSPRGGRRATDAVPGSVGAWAQMAAAILAWQAGTRARTR